MTIHPRHLALALTALALNPTICAQEAGGDEPLTITISTETGTLWRNGAVASSGQWSSKWESTCEGLPIVTLEDESGANNFTDDSDTKGITLAEGSTTPTDRHYTLSVESGYVITGMEFKYKSAFSDLTLTIGGEATFHPTASEQRGEVTGLSERSVPMELSSTTGSNESVTLYDWTVSVVPAEVDTDPHITYSTEGDEHWYYVISSSTKSYCSGKAWFYNESDGELHFDTPSLLPTYMWSFWKNDGEEVAIKSHRGGWVTHSGNNFVLADEPQYGYAIAFYEEGGFSIECPEASSGYHYMHAQETNAVLVHWGLESGNASLWRFEEVDMEGTATALASTSVEQGKVTTGIGNTNVGIIRSTITIEGLGGPLTLTEVRGKVKATDLSDVKAVKAYFASNERELFIDDEETMPWREPNGTLWATGTIDSEGNYTIEPEEGIDLEPGTHYLWICLDISEEATEGNTVDATIESYTLDDETVTEANGDPQYEATIFLAESSPLMPMDLGTLYWRIPAITTSADGQRIVILSDDRTNTNGDLPTHVWVVAQYSEDGGLTWSEPVNVAGKAETGGDYGHGDASLITNRITGDIIGIMTSSPNGYGFNNAGSASAVGENCQAWKTIKSTDGGKTWSTPIDHTKELYGPGSPNENWFAGFSGSGAGLQKRDGTLVSPFINKEEDVNGNVSWNYYNFMSKDGGETWYVSGTSGTTSCDEPKVLERNNGDLAVSVRASGYNYYNYTTDDGATWKNAAQTRFTSGISGNACNGEYMVWCSTIDGNPFDIALQTGCNNSSRMNVSIALSTDEGETFGTPKTICPRGSAYSAATVLPDGTLGVYYEENGIYTGRGDGFTMRFVRFSLDWASDGAYKFTDDSPYHPVQTNVEYEMPDYGWNTIILPFDAEVPAELTAYKCSDSVFHHYDEEAGNTLSALSITPISDTKLSARTPYLIAGPEGDYTFTRPLADWTAQELAKDCEYKDGALVGHFINAKVFGDGETVYRNIRYSESYGGVAVHRITAGAYVNTPAYCCSFEVTNADSDNLFVMEATGEADGLAGVSAPTIAKTKAYDLRGIPRRSGEKGIFVVDGKTMLIK